jgi:hypothetical protein
MAAVLYRVMGAPSVGAKVSGLEPQSRSSTEPST